MRLEDLVLVSVDDHVVEPPDMFRDRLPARYADDAPKVLTRDDGTEVWRFCGMEATNIGLNAVVGRPVEEYGIEPTTFAEIRRGCFDVHERIRDMDANGVIGSLCFPSFPNLCGQLFARATDDRGLGLAVLKAYNDWHLDEWCGAYPGRFIPLGLVPIWDPDAMASEVRRLSSKGCHAVSFSENPSKLKLPSFHSDHWDAFWSACSEEGTIVCLHIGSSSSLVVTAPDAPIDVLLALQPVNIIQAAADLLWSRVLRRFSDLKISLSEGGIGWIPYFLERMDWTFERQHGWTGQDFGGRSPSEVFRDHIVTCFIDDPTGVAQREQVGLETICWEADYPHSDSTWPESPERLIKSLDGVPDPEIDAMTHANAMRHFRYDPFSARRRTECTVGALRANARDVDTAPRARAKGPDGPKHVMVTDLAGRRRVDR